MKHFLFVSLVVSALPCVTNASPQNQSNTPMPKSVFEKIGRDPFARPDKKNPIESRVNERPIYSLNLNGITRENGKSYASISGLGFPLAEGETGSIKAGKTTIKVVCKEIRDDGVFVQVGTNSRVQLRIGAKLQVDEQGTISPK